MTNAMPSDDSGRDDDPRSAADTGPRPRTGGEVTGVGPIQIALAVLVLFLALLAIGVLWPLLTG